MARFMLFLFVAVSMIFTSGAEQFQKVSLIFAQSNLRDLKPALKFLSKNICSVLFYFVYVFRSGASSVRF